MNNNLQDVIVSPSEQTFTNRMLRRIVRPLSLLSQKTGLLRLSRFIRYSSLRNRLTYKEYANSYKIVENRLVIPEFGIPILTKCNLKCEHCSAFSPYSDDIYPTRGIMDSISNWAMKIYPKEVVISGGEPLLHSDCEKILIHTRSTWPYSSIRLISNGILLNNIADDFLKTVSDCNVFLTISDHLGSDGYSKKIQQSCERLDKMGIKYTVYPSRKFWVSLYKMDNDNIPLPYESNPQNAWIHCEGKLHPTLIDNNLYRCCNLAFACYAAKKRLLPVQWSNIQNHQCATLDYGLNEIRDYLTKGTTAECTCCAEKIVLVESKQITPVQLTQIKTRIADSYQ
jgi:hypothetical protein